MSQGALFGSVSEENVARIKRQNGRKISVIIGNPPYNANQLNENDNNKNREYPDIDKRIKETYIAESTAQKTKLYDMYARFFRWASDRLAENGVLAFITNRSFINTRTFDGFRKTVESEFNEIYVLDLGGDVRENLKLSGTRHNVFGIQIGVAISFLVKRHKAQGCRIFYARRPEMETAEEKLTFLSNAKLRELGLEEIRPDARHNWINLTSNDFDSLIPVATKDAKLATKSTQQRAIFKLFSLGAVSNRDEWVYDDNAQILKEKINTFISTYEAERTRWAKSAGSMKTADFVDRGIKWTSELEAHLIRGTQLRFSPSRVVQVHYRPFVKRWNYFSEVVTHRPYQNEAIFPGGRLPNVAIALIGESTPRPFSVLVTDRLADLHYLSNGAGAQCLPLCRYDAQGVSVDNITDWALDRFKKHYQSGRAKPKRPITKAAIFHYVYGILHDPIYREKYAFNLKREFPRIPFYADFWQWADWGKELMDLHIGYEQVECFKLKRTDQPDEKSRKAGVVPKAMLKADKEAGCIVLDSETTLSGIPREAWTYTLGNRSALEWILDQYKEKKPKDPTIREKFDTYCFADYKEKVLDLLARVTTVSLRTVSIVNSMKQAAR